MVPHDLAPPLLAEQVFFSCRGVAEIPRPPFLTLVYEDPPPGGRHVFFVKTLRQESPPHPLFSPPFASPQVSWKPGLLPPSPFGQVYAIFPSFVF